jgi:ubiquinone/menaquinone biosynthesis C-methylase UbiE
MSSASDNETLEKYGGTTYDAATISRVPQSGSDDYADAQLAVKLDLVRRVAQQATVLDVGCGNGAHLLWLSGHIARGVGLDVTPAFIETARRTAAARGVDNVRFVLGDAGQLPFAAGSFAAVYSLSSLYHMARAAQAVAELARVLRSGGWAVLDMGNRRSLNALVCKAHPHLARLCGMRLGEMTRLLRHTGLQVVDHRVFQLLPL